MVGDHTQDHGDHESGDKTKQRHFPWQRYAGEVVVLSLYFWYEAEATWPAEHGKAILFFVAGVSAVLFIETPWRRWLIATGVLIVAGLALYLIAPYPAAPVTTPTPSASRMMTAGDTGGWLVPANLPSAKTSCPDHPFGLDGDFQDFPRNLVVALGESGSVLPFFVGQKGNAADEEVARTENAKPRTIIRIGSCRALIVQRTPSGLAVDADVFNETGFIIAQIRNNQFSLAPSQFASMQRDKNTLAVTDAHGEELFWIKYLNPRSVKVRGYFACQGFAPIHVAEREITFEGGAVFSNICHSFPAGAPDYAGTFVVE